MTNLEYVTSKVESTLSHVKTEMETLKDFDRYSRDSPARPEPYTNPSSSSSANSPELQDKLKSLAILTSSVRSAVSRIEREVHGTALNLTLLQNYLQRNIATKQFVSQSFATWKNQQGAVYPPTVSAPVAVAGTGDLIYGYGQWNLSVPTNCKYTVRKFGINKIQVFGGIIKDSFFVNCYDGWTVSLSS